MTIRIISVGKKHDSSIVQAIAEYEKRLVSHAKLSWDLFPSSDIETESTKIRSKIHPNDYVILLDEHGELVDNTHFSQTIDSNLKTRKDIVLIIGGAYGVNDSMRNAAQEVWSLSGLVLPHQLVRLLIVEQIYRSFNMLAGGKYHHG